MVAAFGVFFIEIIEASFVFMAVIIKPSNTYFSITQLR